MKELLVVKMGTSSLLDAQSKLDQAQFSSVADQAMGLQQTHDTVVITSGAISAGAEEKAVDRRDYEGDYGMLRRLAAVGQPLLMERWRKAFGRHGQAVGQLLITPYELNIDQESKLFIETLASIALAGDIAVVNENDAVADDEIKLGDNDRLSALVAAALGRLGLWSSVSLVLLSDVDALYEQFGTSRQKKIVRVDDIDSVLHLGGAIGSQHGRGGMRTKLEAARIAGAAGVDMYIGDGRRPDVIRTAINGQTGTHFVAKKSNKG